LSYPAPRRYKGQAVNQDAGFSMTEFYADATIARANMVDSQVRPNQVNDPRVIGAMRALPREAFAPAGARVYADADIALGGGRYLLAPMTIARLCQLVLSGNPAKILVIGAGAGYGAAILAAGGAAITALESEPRLAAGALENGALESGPLARFAPGAARVSGRLADGWPAGAPYDCVFIEGAVPAIPAGLAAQLAPGGRLVTILADGDSGGLGRAVIAESRGQGFAIVKIFDCTARIIPEFNPAPVFVF
jgi:protein-L-isoaspartate(D-aspartate) O-methyltransferase